MIEFDVKNGMINIPENQKYFNKCEIFRVNLESNNFKSVAEKHKVFEY